MVADFHLFRIFASIEVVDWNYSSHGTGPGIDGLAPQIPTSARCRDRPAQR